MKKESYEKRVGSGIKWQMITREGTEIISGFTIDNLDNKAITDAKSEFERIFITARQVLEAHESSCLDEEAERLTVCQVLSENLHRLFKKERKSAAN